MSCKLDISYYIYLPLSRTWIKEGRICTLEQEKAKKPRAFTVVEIGTELYLAIQQTMHVRDEETRERWPLL
jgi:hypothetical protein